MPGGKRATVYALREELDAWASSQSRLPADDDAAAEAASPVHAPAPRRLRPVVIAMLLMALSSGAVAFCTLKPQQNEQAIAKPRLPADPAAARLFLQARDDWAKREPDSLTRAMAAFVEVTRREPGFAPAHAGLAEAYLLAREFGALPDGAAFAKAKAAAEKAMALDPNAGEAYRALGFISYWRDHDAPTASKAFLRAKALSPDNAQTHFWYGNILSDNGSHAGALRELNAARLIEPGSTAIQTDLAWALWSAGREDEAMQMLQDLLASHPNFAVIHDCLSAIHLARGDYAGYARAFSAFARLRNDAALIRQAADVQAALSNVPTAQAVMMAQARANLAGNAGQDHVWAAFLASVAQDRNLLLSILDTADQRGELWGSSGLVSRIADRWREDSLISEHLARRRAKPIE